MRLSKGTSVIRSLEDWRAFAPPKGGDRQWKDGRSAKELARAWCGVDGPCAPPELAELLSSLASTEQLAATEGWPEHQIRIDHLPGEPPNIDLALVLDGHHGRTVVCVEAKADEPLGEDVLSLLNSAVVRIARDERTGAVQRLQCLAETVLPSWEPGLPHLADIRYQLLTATAATLALAAQHAARVAALVIHEFDTDGAIDPSKARRNANDFDQFIRRMTKDAHRFTSDGELVPIHRPSWAAAFNVPLLYVGKVTSRTRGSVSPAP